MFFLQCTPRSVFQQEFSVNHRKKKQEDYYYFPVKSLFILFSLNILNYFSVYHRLL